MSSTKMAAVLVPVAATALAGWLSVSLSSEHYRVAPYHNDSAAHRWQAVSLERSREAFGLSGALAWSLRHRDQLDQLLRLLVAPSLLLQRFGHLWVALPFMGGFLFLLNRHVFERTGDVALGAAATALLFSFPFLYDPNGGLADDARESAAVWLLGSACLAWLRSSALRRRGPSFACGVLLGLLAWQRAVAALYLVLLLLPLVAGSALRRLREDGLGAAWRRVACFAVPAALLGAACLGLQWPALERHYLVLGYDYATPTHVAGFLIDSLPARLGLGLLVVPAAGLVCALSERGGIEPGRLATATWLAAGLPLAVIATGALYSGLAPLLSVLLVVSLATLMPARQRWAGRHALALVLILAAVIASTLQYRRSAALARRPPPTAHLRELFRDVSALVPSGRGSGVKFLVDEIDVSFLNQAFFDEGRRSLSQGPGLVSIHDSYYRARFADLDVAGIAAASARELEGAVGAPRDRISPLAAPRPAALWAVGYCEPSPARGDPRFRANGVLVALPVVMALNQHVRRSPHWQAVGTLASPAYGCLFVYRYSSEPLSASQKWAGVGPAREGDYLAR